MQSVPLIVQGVSRELMVKRHDSILPLYPSGSLTIGRFGESLMKLAMESTESDLSLFFPVLGDLYRQWKEFQGWSHCKSVWTPC